MVKKRVYVISGAIGVIVLVLIGSGLYNTFINCPKEREAYQLGCKFVTTAEELGLDASISNFEEKKNKFCGCAKTPSFMFLFLK